MKAFWPTNKSSLIESMVTILDEDVQERFLSLDPEDQCAMSFAYMLTAAQDDTEWTKDVLVKTWLDRLENLNGCTGKTVVGCPSQPPAAAKVHIQLVMAGMPSIMAGTVASVMTQVTPTLHQDMELEFFPHI